MNLEEKSIIFWEKSEGEKWKTNFNELFFLKKLDVMNDQRGKWRKIEKHLRSHHLNFPSVENSIIIELNMDERGRGSKCSDESPWRCSICLISMSSSSFRYERLWFVSMYQRKQTHSREKWRGCCFSLVIDLAIHESSEKAAHRDELVHANILWNCGFDNRIVYHQSRSKRK